MLAAAASSEGVYAFFPVARFRGRETFGAARRFAVRHPLADMKTHRATALATASTIGYAVSVDRPASQNRARGIVPFWDGAAKVSSAHAHRPVPAVAMPWSRHYAGSSLKRRHWRLCLVNNGAVERIWTYALVSHRLRLLHDLPRLRRDGGSTPPTYWAQIEQQQSIGSERRYLGGRPRPSCRSCRSGRLLRPSDQTVGGHDRDTYPVMQACQKAFAAHSDAEFYASCLRSASGLEVAPAIPVRPSYRPKRLRHVAGCDPAPRWPLRHVDARRTRNVPIRLE